VGIITRVVYGKERNTGERNVTRKVLPLAQNFALGLSVAVLLNLFSLLTS
jgi:hypothetical protein